MFFFIITCLQQDFNSIRKNKWISWHECYEKNYIYTPGFFIREIIEQKLTFYSIFNFIWILLLIKFIIKIQIFFY
uniref:Uncharacterized protein n=1 Tax=Oxytricha trifallax TaxID=1172189 RepID=G9HRJ8_9SPIT|nr:hypothetical protein [Oxytricha trifallax]